MKNVGMKPESYRVAEAQAILYAPPHCIELLRQGNTEKGCIKNRTCSRNLGSKTN